MTPLNQILGRAMYRFLAIHHQTTDVDFLHGCSDEEVVKAIAATFAPTDRIDFIGKLLEALRERPYVFFQNSYQTSWSYAETTAWVASGQEYIQNFIDYCTILLCNAEDDIIVDNDKSGGMADLFLHNLPKPFASTLRADAQAYSARDLSLIHI